MKKRYLKSKLYLALVGFVVGLFLWFGTQSTLQWALKREAQVIGMDWAHHVENRLEGIKLARLPDGSKDPAALPKPDELRSLVAGVFAIGHIFQFDYINTDCHCHVSLTPTSHETVEEVASGSSGHEGHAHGGHAHAGQAHDAPAQSKPDVTVAEKVSNGFWQHVALGHNEHAGAKANTSDNARHPVNYDLVRKIAEQRSHDIFIKSGRGAELPSTFAEVYHPVVSGGQVIYLIRMMVNLEVQALLYKQLLAIAALGGAALIAALVGYPTWRYIVIAAGRRQADKRAAFLANHDVLTNLYNRNNFQETISDIIWRCHERHQAALMFVFDLNDFKEIKDYYGHPVGDKVLCEFARLLKEIAPENSYIARLGGDEFVVVISAIEQVEFDFRDYLDVPNAVSVTINGGRQTVTSPIAGGVVRYPRDAETVEELVQLADLALYAAKPHRAGKVCEFIPEYKEQFFDRLKVREEFAQALEASQIEPYYQPIVNMRTGMVEGFEALARWIHPEKGVLTPFVFAEVLEDGEVSAKLGQLMFEKIADEMADWSRACVPFRKVALNVTDGDLKSASFADDLLEGLQLRGLKAANLTIEVTENCVFGSEKARSMGHLRKLRKAGCAIALDDFGTGYSSITQIKELPVTTIKIDKSFIDNVLEDHADQSIISAMLELGQSMRFNLVMEGIETESQLALLRRMGSELAQGYYFARPMPAAEVPAFIQRQNARYDDALVRQRAG